VAHGTAQPETEFDMDNYFVFSINKTRAAWSFLEEHQEQRGGLGMVVTNKNNREVIFEFNDPEDSLPFESFLQTRSISYQKFTEGNLPKRYAKLLRG
jgi:hypothetical protein